MLGFGNISKGWNWLKFEDSNVGYTTVDVPAGTMKMLGCQFETTQSTDVDLQNFVVGNFEGAFDAGDAALVMILGADGKYTSYYYLEEAYDEELDDFVPGWANMYGDKVSVPLKTGDAIWFKNADSCKLQFNGQVLGDASVKVNPPVGSFKMMANPFPVAIDINGAKVDSSELEGAYDTGDAALVMILGADGKYTSYYYLEEAYDEDLDDFVPGWANMYGDKVAIDVGVAEAFWLKLNATGSITFNK